MEKDNDREPDRKFEGANTGSTTNRNSPRISNPPKVSGTTSGRLSDVISSSTKLQSAARPQYEEQPAGSAGSVSKRVSIRDESQTQIYTGLRRLCWQLLDEEGGRFDYAMCGVILSNVCLMVVETEGNADCASEPSVVRCRKDAITVLNQVFLAIYTLEFMIRFYVLRCNFWNSVWNLLDFIVVILGYIDVLLLVLETDKMPGPSMSLLRIFRVFRLMRAMKMFKKIKELHAMLRGFVSAMQSMFWGFVMISVLLLIFAILCVEIVNPISIKVHEDNPYCRDAFRSVWYCMLMFFQALVAGDSWGHCTLPIIKDTFWTVIIFVIALVSIQLGFMNLILAVIVERAYDAKAQDEEEHRKDKEEKEMAATKRLRNLFESIDADQSGSISLEELLDGYDYNDDMKNMFAMLDMSRDDLEVLFALMDVDDTNDILYDDLIHNLRATIASDRKNLAMVRLQVAEVGRLMKKMNERRTIMSSQAPSPITSTFPTRANTRNMAKVPAFGLQHGLSSVESISETGQYILDTAKLDSALENLKLEEGREDYGRQKSSVSSIADSSPQRRERGPARALSRLVSYNASTSDLDMHAWRDSLSKEFILLRSSIRGLIESLGVSGRASQLKKDEFIFELGSNIDLEKNQLDSVVSFKEDTGELLVKELNQTERQLLSPAHPRLWDNLNAQEDARRNASATQKWRDQRSLTTSTIHSSDASPIRRNVQGKASQRIGSDNYQGSNGLRRKTPESPSLVQNRGDVSL